MNAQIMGLITGVLFGFLLQKGRVLRFEKQVGAMLFRDMTIFKFMLSAIIVGQIGLHLALSQGWIPAFSIKAANLGAVMLGGAAFGLGWALMGYCPGTAFGALGEGRWHAVWGILGMVLGAALYARLFPWLSRTVLTWSDLGKITLPEVLGVSPWLVIVLFILVCLGCFALFEKRRI